MAYANHQDGVRNDPGGNGVANTITNVLFLMLALRRYQTLGDAAALATAKAVFDWFYPDQQSGPNNLFNAEDLVRQTPVRADPNNPDKRAWTGDQGWFWRLRYARRARQRRRLKAANQERHRSARDRRGQARVGRRHRP
jgi:hypothetical protein